MDDHLNLWVSVPSRPPYVVQCDRDAVTEHNASCQAEGYREYQLQTDALPEPFIGNIKASVVQLNLNPAFAEENVAEHERPRFKRCSKVDKPFGMYPVEQNAKQ